MQDCRTAVFLQKDLAVRFHFFADLHDLLHNLVKPPIVGVHHHLLGHKADSKAVHTGIFRAASSIFAAQLAQSTSILNFFCIMGNFLSSICVYSINDVVYLLSDVLQSQRQHRADVVVVQRIKNHLAFLPEPHQLTGLQEPQLMAHR